jgi:hypothetical protein
MTLTDSKAKFRPISSRYRGTSCAVAFATVTRGGGKVAELSARAAPRLHEAGIESSGSSKISRNTPTTSAALGSVV